MLANFKAQLNKRPEAIALVQQAIAADPKIAESYWRLAYLYFVFGDRPSARRTLDTAGSLGLTFAGTPGEAIVQEIMTAPSTTPAHNTKP